MAVAAPALIKLNYDEEYRRSLLDADLTLADSGLLVFLWKLVTGRTLKKVSGLAYLKALLGREEVRRSMFWVLPSQTAREKTLEWLGRRGFPTSLEDCYVAAVSKAEDYALLQQIEQRKPQNIIVAIPGGSQEKMGLYLRSYLLYRPRIHCIGAALGFLTGEERPIPDWADRYALGWLWRIVSQPQMLLPRLGIACRVGVMVLKYRSQLPPLRTRWVDR